MNFELISSCLNRISINNSKDSLFFEKRVLVTGGAGFIGSWLVEALVRLGAEVFVVDNLWRGSLDNLKKEDGSYWIPVDDHFILGDLRDYHVARFSSNEIQTGHHLSSSRYCSRCGLCFLQ